MNFLESYWPDDADVSADAILAARVRLEKDARTAFSTINLRPGSVAGDNLLGPMALWLAKLDLATSRFMSDLQPANVAAGTAYNCEFVEAFLDNFGTRDQVTMRTRGVVRLTFSDGDRRSISRGQQFNIAGSLFDLVLPMDGDLELIPEHEALPTGTNAARIAPVGDGSYVADVPVAGDIADAEDLPDAGTAVEVSTPEPDGLTDAATLGEFLLGSAPTALSTRASQAMHATKAATLTTAAGAVNLLYQNFPDLLSAEAVPAGHPANLRSAANALGIRRGKMDMFVRGPQWDTMTDMSVVCDRVTNAGVVYYTAWLPLTQPIMRVVRITHTPTGGGSDIVLRPNAGAKIYSQTLSSARAPGITGAGSELNALLLAIPQPALLNSTASISTFTDGGSIKALFTVRVLNDPAFNSVSTVVRYTSIQPVGVDALLRSPSVIEVASMAIEAVRKPGFRPNQTQALSDIRAHLRLASSSGQKVSTARIADALFYAGYQDVGDITMSAQLHVSAATHYLSPIYAIDDPAATPWDIVDVAIPGRAITTIDGLRMADDFIDPDIGENTETGAWASEESVAIWVPEDVIVINETT